MVMSDCGVEFDTQVKSPDMYPGTVYAVPDSNYSLKTTYQWCDAWPITDNYATMEIRKNDTLIATHKFYMGGDPTLFDDSNLCIALGLMDCQSYNPAEWYTRYWVYYNILPCTGVVCPDVCVDNDLYSQVCDPATGNCVLGALIEANALECLATHFLDIRIKPHSWYSPGGAADWVTSHLIELNGALLNVFKDVTDYEYLGVSIFTDGGYVVIRTHLKSLSAMSMSPGGPVLVEISYIATVILAIVVVMGIIVGVYLVTNTLAKLFGKDYTKAEVGTLLNDVLTRGDAECADAFPTDPVGYANCMKAITKSVTGAGSDFFKDPEIKTAGEGAAAEIDACTAQYNIDLNVAKLEACVKGAVDGAKKAITKAAKEEDCWIPSPLNGCLLTAKTGKIIVGATVFTLGALVIYELIKD